MHLSAVIRGEPRGDTRAWRRICQLSSLTSSPGYGIGLLLHFRSCIPGWTPAGFVAPPPFSRAGNECRSRLQKGWPVGENVLEKWWQKRRYTTFIFLKVKNDHRSKFFNLSNWKEEAWKKSGLQRDSNPWPPRYRAFSPNWAMKPHIGNEVNLLSSYLPWGVKWCEVYEIIHIWTAVVDESEEWSINWPRSQCVAS